MTVLEHPQPISDRRMSSDGPPDDFQPYRSLSRSAIVSLVLGIFGTGLGLLFPAMLVLAAIGIFAGIVGYLSIKNHPQEYAGLGIAKTGLVLSLLGFFGGTILHTVIYFTEVPPGFERVTFYEIRPENPKARPVNFPQKVFDIDGKEIFIKGYVHPSIGDGRKKHFILVPDMGTCCFGGQPDPTDMIEVTLDTPEGIRYNTSVRKLAGKFQLAPMRKVGELQGVVYKLDATYVQ